MNREVTYYAGVYNNKVRGQDRVCNVSDCIDGISCEILADPGVASCCFSSVKKMIEWSLAKARKWECSHIEINCARGQGTYKWLKVK